MAERLLRLRQQYPRWGKDKLVCLLRREGSSVSTSMVGRILTHLKRRGLLVEPLPVRLKARRSRPARPYALRKPHDYQPQRPGDLVQVDTRELRPLPGVILKQFTARDGVSRGEVIEAHSRATASLAAQFPDALQQQMALHHPGRAGRGGQ